MRLFAAVWPPPDAMVVPRRWPGGPHPELRWTPPEDRHVTLAYFGEVPADRVPLARAALGQAAQGPTARDRTIPDAAALPEAVLGPATALLGDAVLVAPAAGLETAAGAVRRAAVRLGLEFDRRPFVGHLTLARARRGRPIPPDLVGVPLAARWPVVELRLVASVVREGRTRYEPVAVAALPGAGPTIP